MSIVSDRIEKIITSEGLSIRAFEAKIGASNGSIATAIKKGTDVSTLTLCKILASFPELSADWLLSGEGGMHKYMVETKRLSDRLSDTLNSLEYEKNKNIAECLGLSQIELINFTNRMIFPEHPFDLVEFCKEYPEISYEWLLTGIGKKFNGDENECLRAIKERIYNKNHSAVLNRDTKEATAVTQADPEIIGSKPAGIPLIPYSAFAGYGSENYQDLVVEDYYTVREFKDADFLLRVTGDSMLPKLANGEIIACKLVDGLSFWQWNKIYAICTRTQGILIKRVEECPGNPAYIRCVSDNPKYRPFDIHDSEIQAIALVLGAIVIE